MKKAMMLLSTLLVSFTAHASFYRNLGLPGEFPNEDAKEVVLQNILLDSAEIAFASANVYITMETSLTEIKKHFPIGEGFIKILLNEAAARIQAQGCSLTIESGMAKKIYDRGIKSPSSPGGSITRVGQLLPILNSNITCP